MRIFEDSDICKCRKPGVCPVTALSLDDEGKSECNEDICITCLACTGACPVSAISEK